MTMGLSFQPKSEKELAEAQLAPNGEYDFDVLKAEDRISKTGNAMIYVKLGVYHGESVRWHVDDYLLPKMESKLRHFCDTTGILARYESGSLGASDCMGRSGRVKLMVDEKDPAYPPKNVVRDYVSRKAKLLTHSEQSKSSHEDDVPF